MRSDAHLRMLEELAEGARRGEQARRSPRAATANRSESEKMGKPVGAYFNTLVSGCSDHDVEQLRKVALGNSQRR